jgi:hypothetical protein
MVSVNSSFNFNIFQPSFFGGDLPGAGADVAASPELAQVATILADAQTQQMARMGALAAGAMMQHQLNAQLGGGAFGMGAMNPAQVMAALLGQMMMAQLLGQALQARGFGGHGAGCGGGGLGGLGGGDFESLLNRLLGQHQQRRGGGGFGGGGASGGYGAPSPSRTPSVGGRSRPPVSSPGAPGVSNPMPTGTGAGNRALSVAQSQIGVREATGNNDGIPAQRYSNGRREPWCANFISWAYRQAGHQLPGNQRSLASVQNMEDTMKRNGKWFGRGQGTPQPGDIIFFGNRGGSDRGPGRHVGMVEKVENGRVFTIEGNSSNSVRRRSYPLNASRITGYGRM